LLADGLEHVRREALASQGRLLSGARWRWNLGVGSRLLAPLGTPSSASPSNPSDAILV